MHSDKLSTTSGENRRSTKPIMEKRRRARINASLSELKSLLLDAIKKEGARHNKMEKADILEMTVKHLRQMQKHQFTAAAADDPSISNKHHLGFNECAQEVSRYLMSTEGCDVELRARLLDHLANCISSSDSPSPPVTSHPVPPQTQQAPVFVPPVVHSSSPQSKPSSLPQTIQSHSRPPDINNNVPELSPPPTAPPPKVVSGLHVIPTKLQTGEIAFVLPTNVVGGGHVPNYIIPVYTSPTAPSSTHTVTMPTAVQGAITPAPVMVLPQTDVYQTCTVAQLSGNINIIPRPCSSIPSVSSLSTQATPQVSTVHTNPGPAILSLSPQQRPVDNVPRDLENMNQNGGGEDSMWRPW